MFAQHVAKFGHEPGIVTRLDGDAHTGTERPQRSIEARQLDGEVGRELQQHGPEMRTQLARVRHQALDGFFRIAEALVVRQVPACLTAISKSAGTRAFHYSKVAGGGSR